MPTALNAIQNEDAVHQPHNECPEEHDRATAARRAARPSPDPNDRRNARPLQQARGQPPDHRLSEPDESLRVHRDHQEHQQREQRHRRADEQQLVDGPAERPSRRKEIPAATRRQQQQEHDDGVEHAIDDERRERRRESNAPRLVRHDVRARQFAGARRRHVVHHHPDRRRAPQRTIGQRPSGGLEDVAPAPGAERKRQCCDERRQR